MMASLNLTSPEPGNDGLFRTRLAGHHARTSEAFSALRDQLGLLSSAPHGEAGLYGGSVPVSDDPEEGKWELISIRDEILLVVSDGYLTRQHSESVLPEGYIEFHFMVAGPVSVEFSETGRIEVTSPNLTVVHQGDDMHYQVSCGPGLWRSVGLYISRDYFHSFLRASMGVDGPLWQQLQKLRNEQVFCHQMPVNPEVLTAVKQLLENPYEGYRRLLFAQAKAYEVMCASLDLWQAYLESHHTAEVFSSRDLRLIEKARDLLVGDLRHMMTIPELARAVGTNTSKLKRGFKFLYGMTVFECGHRARMDRALELLGNERLSVNEVAFAVGYQHQTSFTASFRDYFGFAPKDARRMADLRNVRARSSSAPGVTAGEDL